MAFDKPQSLSGPQLSHLQNEVAGFKTLDYLNSMPLAAILIPEVMKPWNKISSGVFLGELEMLVGENFFNLQIQLNMKASREEDVSSNPHSSLFKVFPVIFIPKRIHTLEN